MKVKCRSGKQKLNGAIGCGNGGEVGRSRNGSGSRERESIRERENQ